MRLFKSIGSSEIMVSNRHLPFQIIAYEFINLKKKDDKNTKIHAQSKTFIKNCRRYHIFHSYVRGSLDQADHRNDNEF